MTNLWEKQIYICFFYDTHTVIFQFFYKHSFPHENVGKEQLKIFIFVHKYDIYKIFALENKNFKTELTTFIFLAILFYLTPKACPEVI